MKYLYEKKSDSELQLWPRTSSEKYLSTPTLPDYLLNGNNRSKISAPKELEFDVLANRGIFNAAITEHNGNYYQMRADSNLGIILYILEGQLEIRFSSHTYKIGKSKVFLCPAGASYELKAKNAVKIIWFHVKGEEWSLINFNSPVILKSKYGKKLKDVVSEYYEEVYKPNRALRLLEIYADLISYFIREEFSKITDNHTSIVDSAIIEIRENIHLPSELIAKIPNIEKSERTIKKVLGLTVHEICIKIKMSKARELLTQKNLTLQQISQKIGYSDAYAFSRAFKKMHGVSPKIYQKQRN